MATAQILMVESSCWPSTLQVEKMDQEKQKWSAHCEWAGDRVIGNHFTVFNVQCKEARTSLTD